MFGKYLGAVGIPWPLIIVVGENPINHFMLFLLKILFILACFLYDALYDALGLCMEIYQNSHVYSIRHRTSCVSIRLSGKVLIYMDIVHINIHPQSFHIKLSWIFNWTSTHMYVFFIFLSIHTKRGVCSVMTML